MTLVTYRAEINSTIKFLERIVIEDYRTILEYFKYQYEQKVNDKIIGRYLKTYSHYENNGDAFLQLPRPTIYKLIDAFKENDFRLILNGSEDLNSIIDKYDFGTYVGNVISNLNYIFDIKELNNKNVIILVDEYNNYLISKKFLLKRGIDQDKINFISKNKLVINDDNLFGQYCIINQDLNAYESNNTDKIRDIINSDFYDCLIALNCDKYFYTTYQTMIKYSNTNMLYGLFETPLDLRKSYIYDYLGKLRKIGK